MRFQKKFTRYVVGSDDEAVIAHANAAVAQVLLGSDEVPTGPNDVARDNAFESQQCNISGWPVQRVLVAYVGPAEQLEATAYVFEELTRSWFKVRMSGPLVSGELAAIDTPCMLEQNNVRSPVNVLLVVKQAVGVPHPVGEYKFAFGADVSNPGL